MKAQKKNESPSTAPYNDAVQKAYDALLAKSLHLLASLERDELRHVLERKRKGSQYPIIVHELVSPLFYLRLELGEDGRLAIHFGAEPSPVFPEVQAVTAGFLRLLFTLTCKACTGIDIEDCVKTDWLINACSDPYEHLEGNAGHHTLRKVPYSKAARKRELEVA